MSSSEKQKPAEVVVPWDYVEFMKNDHTVIVVMALPTADEGMFSVTYLSKEDGELPSWIVDREAA